MLKKSLKKMLESESVKNLTTKSKDLGKGAWAGAIVAANQVSEWGASTDWMASINKGFTNAITKAMDSGYKIGSIDPETAIKMSPNNHRILDGGHTLGESFQRAADHVQAEGGSTVDTYLEWAKAYVSDLSSKAGMPAPFAEEIYGFLHGTLKIDEESVRDLVTVNGQEALDALLGGTITLLAVIFSWKDGDKQRFSETLGAIGISSILTLNPVSACIAVTALAIGYNKDVICKESAKRGVFINSAAIGLSCLIPGPILIGAVPAMALAFYLNKKLDKKVPVEQQVKAWAQYMASPGFRELLKKHQSEVSDWMGTRLRKIETAA